MVYLRMSSMHALDKTHRGFWGFVITRSVLFLTSNKWNANLVATSSWNQVLYKIHIHWYDYHLGIKELFQLVFLWCFQVYSINDGLVNRVTVLPWWSRWVCYLQDVSHGTMMCVRPVATGLLTVQPSLYMCMR